MMHDILIYVHKVDMKILLISHRSEVTVAHTLVYRCKFFLLMQIKWYYICVYCTCTPKPFITATKYCNFFVICLVG